MSLPEDLVVLVTLRTLRVKMFISDAERPQHDDRVGMFISDAALRVLRVTKPQHDGRVKLFISDAP